MKFDQVLLKHITLALQDLKEKGLPIGFKPSAYFDVEIDGKLYPPKPIMAYANYHATGEEPTNNFSGGADTSCFKAFEHLGIPIIKKTESMSANKKLHQLKQDFLDCWPLEKLQSMTLEEYTDTNRENSFCYWLEHITRDLGSIVGGSSYKFGIYKRNSQGEVKEESNRTTDGEYAWFKKYGEESKEQAFEKVKSFIVKIAEAAQKNTLDVIDPIDLGNAYKWKIAFLYGDYNCVNMFKLDALRVIGSNLAIDYNNKTPISYFQQTILNLKPVEEDYFTYCHALWQEYQERLIDVKKDFAKWLNKNTFESYRAYLGNTNKSIEEKLDEINAFFDEVDFFLVDPKKVNGVVSTILFLMSKKERVKNPEFVDYDSKNSNGIPKAILGKNNYIKFLKEKFDYVAPNYWIFQGNPRMFDFETALRDDILTDWTVSAHKNKIKIGDKVILWITGSKAGCYALAEVTSKPRTRNTSPDDHLWKEEDKSELKADIKVTHNLVNNPILNEDTQGVYELNDLKVGHQGTNFSASEKEFNTFLNWHLSKLSTMHSKKISNKKIVNPLNQILYGPPGTGKTYNTVNSALKIVDPEFYEDNKLNRVQLKERFDKYVLDGNIMFTTFHQSMGYEDFIEGIKPISVENEVKYDVEDGIFKEACIRAKGIPNEIKTKVNIDFSSKSFFKMSLGGKHQKNVHNWCIENNLIALGWGRNNDFSELKGINQFEVFRDIFNSKYPELVQESRYNIQAVYCFLNWMKKGDIVLVSLGNKIIDAIGVIEGDYEFMKDSKHSYHHTRKVRWLGTNLDTSPKLFVEKNISQQTIYNFNPEDIIIDRFEREFNILEVSKSENENYVLIIDEINRGNVSSIFGELITLLETDKRKGNKEELEVILPYSKEPFSIPNNLHIIGTMNTADRSVEALDTALRRRFSFVEMMPDYTVIKDESVGEIKLSNVLETINQRIELLIDRDHTIGHSYFVGVNTEKKLANAFKNKIVPLLQEYFYGDYGKIGLVLGKGFIKREKNKGLQFSSFKYDGKEDFITPSFTLKPIDKTTIVQAVGQLFETTES